MSRHVGAPAVVGEGGAARTQALVKITPEPGFSIRAVVGKTLLEAKVCDAPALSHLSVSAVALATSGRNEHGVPGPCPHRNHPLALGTVQTSGRRDEKLGVTPLPLRTSASVSARGREGQAGRRGLRLGGARGSTPLRKLGVERLSPAHTGRPAPGCARQAGKPHPILLGTSWPRRVCL